jgi:hypothetical protein
MMKEQFCHVAPMLRCFNIRPVLGRFLLVVLIEFDRFGDTRWLRCCLDSHAVPGVSLVLLHPQLNQSTVRRCGRL